MTYQPRPLDTSRVRIPPELAELTELLANHIHDVWARRRIAEGWTWGAERDDVRRHNPTLAPYHELPESEKQYDRDTALEALKAIVSLGYRILPPERSSDDTPAGGVPECLQRAGLLWAEGKPIEAYDMLDAALRQWPGHPEIRRQRARALIACGVTERANEELERLVREGHDDEETLGLLARTHKDLWLRDPDSQAGRRHLDRAYHVYLTSYRSGGQRRYWTGINAAALAVAMGDLDTAHDLARQVREACMQELQSAEDGLSTSPLRHCEESSTKQPPLPPSSSPSGRGAGGEGPSSAQARHDWPGNAYWPLATLGEAALILGERDEAQAWYRRAREAAGDRYQWLASTRRNAEMLVGRLGIESPARSRALDLPAVAVSDDPAPSGDIEAWLAEHDVGIGYGCLQTEADAAFLEAVLDRGGEIHVVLPGQRDMCRREALLARAATVREASMQPFSDSAASWAYARILALGMARIHARQLGTALIRMPPGSPLPHALPHCVKSLLFADVAGYSALREDQVPLFTDRFLGAVATLIARSAEQPEVVNTWGDALYMVFAQPVGAAQFALQLVNTVQGTDWSAHGQPAEMGIRVSLHAGPVHEVTDPVTGRHTFTGTHVSRAARIEPITPPGHVYTSESFAAVLAALEVEAVVCDYVGETPLAKGYGVYRTYHLRRNPGARVTWPQTAMPDSNCC